MKTHYTMITETCSCWAKIEIETPNPDAVAEFITQWRTKHQHYVNYPYRYVYPTYTYPGTYPYVTYGVSSTTTSHINKAGAA